MSATVALLLALSLVALRPSSASAAAGDLDPTFGGDGRVVTDFGDSRETIKAVGVQKDGKIVVGGKRVFTEQMVLARYLPDGTLDPAFGASGIVYGPFDGFGQGVDDLVIQSDGKIVALGIKDNFTVDFLLARFNPNGTLDSTFGSAGTVETDFSGRADSAVGLALQGDGKLVAAGYSTPYSNTSGTTDFVAARYITNGTLDLTFSGDGRVRTGFASDADDYGRDVAIDPSGKIVVAGRTASEAGVDAAAVRYRIDGTLDPGFSSDGKKVVDFPGPYDGEDIFSVAIQSNSRIVIGGSVWNGQSGDFALARIKSDGPVDTSFSGDGRRRINFSSGNDTGNDAAAGLLIQSDGKIVVVGAAGEVVGDFGVARLLSTGANDPAFSEDGKLLTDFAGGDQATAVAIQADGRLVVVGGSDTFSPDWDFALARYLT